MWLFKGRVPSRTWSLEPGVRCKLTKWSSWERIRGSHWQEPEQRQCPHSNWRCLLNFATYLDMDTTWTLCFEPASQEEINPNVESKVCYCIVIILERGWEGTKEGYNMVKVKPWEWALRFLNNEMIGDRENDSLSTEPLEKMWYTDAWNGQSLK